MGSFQASHTVEIDAPRQRVYDVAADVPGALEWNPAIVGVDVIETDSQGRTELIEIEGDVKVKRTKSIMRFAYSEPDGLSWVQEKGELKSLVGRWVLKELDGDRTEATYALEIDPGRMLGMLLRGPVLDQVKVFLTKGAAEGIKEHVEAGK